MRTLPGSPVNHTVRSAKPLLAYHSLRLALADIGEVERAGIHCPHCTDEAQGG